MSSSALPELPNMPTHEITKTYIDTTRPHAGKRITVLVLSIIVSIVSFALLCTVVSRVPHGGLRVVLLAGTLAGSLSWVGGAAYYVNGNRKSTTIEYPKQK